MKTCLKEQKELVSKISEPAWLRDYDVTGCEVHHDGWLGIMVSVVQQTGSGIMTNERCKLTLINQRKGLFI